MTNFDRVRQHMKIKFYRPSVILRIILSVHFHRNYDNNTRLTARIYLTDTFRCHLMH